jgi:2-polyprenyl-6-methoxyphenol hydroxylase-like FAD-dependent oxidoreductase
MDFDVIIIGARVAGSALATLLGQYGHHILILDKATFPSDTLSTHFFRAPAFKVFERMGVFDQILLTTPKLINSFSDFDGQVSNQSVEDSGDYNYYLCVRRITLDDILLKRVQREATIELHQGATLDELIWEGERVVGVRWREANVHLEAKARVVIGADGFYSQVAKQVKPIVEHSEPVNRAMYYAYFQGLQSQDGPAAEFHLRGNHLVYVFPTDNSLTLIAASVPIVEFDEFRKDPERRLMTELEALLTLAPRLRHAERFGSVRGAGNIPGYMRIPYGQGWALAGDAELVQDPWSGKGIDHASTHAALLADSLHIWLSDEMGWEQAMKQYHAARNEFSLETYQQTCTYSRDLSLLNSQ